MFIRAINAQKQQRCDFDVFPEFSLNDLHVFLVSVLDAGRPAPGGGGPSGPGFLSGWSTAAAGLREPAPVGSGSRSAAVPAPAGLHHRDPPQTVPQSPAGPAPSAGGRCSPHQPRRAHHLSWTGSAGLLPGPEPGQLQEGEQTASVCCGGCEHVLKRVLFPQSVRWYVDQLEKTVITLCGRFGIEASTSPHTGVWVGDNKICAIGT